MGVFVCDKCGCVENTALGRYWMKDYDDMWDTDNLGLALCSECAPTHYKDGSETGFNHTWHGKFPKKQWDGKREVENRKPLFEDVLADEMKRDAKYKNGKRIKKRK